MVSVLWTPIAGWGDGGRIMEDTWWGAFHTNVVRGNAMCGKPFDIADMLSAFDKLKEKRR